MPVSQNTLPADVFVVHFIALLADAFISHFIAL